jgi:serine protease AprX
VKDKKQKNRMMKRRLLMGLLLTSCLLLMILGGFNLLPQRMGTRAQAAGHSKISPDLEEKINGEGNNMIPVIFTTQGESNTALETDLPRWRGALKKVFKNVNGMSVNLPANVIAGFAARSDVAYIALDRTLNVSGHLEATTGADQARNYGTAAMGAIDGAGKGAPVGIAILDSGVDPNNHAFLISSSSSSTQSRIVANVDFTGEKNSLGQPVAGDPYGHGTHVASIAAGNSHISSGAYTGIAPRSNIINVRVLDSKGQGTTSAAIAGIDWCITNKATYNIKVLNLSFGGTAVDSYRNDLLCQAVRRAVDSGLVVCVAAGNAGHNDVITGYDASGKPVYQPVYGGVHSPGIEPSAITVGAVNTLGTDNHSDDSIATYSSRGPTRSYSLDPAGVKHYDNLIKPDLVAPGNKIIAAESPNNYLVKNNPSLDATTSPLSSHKVMTMSGTSMATPAVAGAAALVLQRNPSLTPNLVKMILEYTSDPLNGFNNLDQGTGELNVEGAVRLAGLISQKLNRPPVGAPLLTGPPPRQTTNVANESFNWSGGIVQNWNFVYGTALINSYQGIYGPTINAGALLTDGVVVSNGIMVSNGTMLSNGIMLSNGVVLSDGVVLANGVSIVPGTNLSDGIVLSDGVVVSNGVVLSDSTLTGMSSQSVHTSGDATICMIPMLDASTW